MNLKKIIREEIDDLNWMLDSEMGMKGTQEDMKFILKSIMDKEVKEQIKYCSYRIVPTPHSVELIVFIPKPLPEHEGLWMYDQRIRNEVKEYLSKTIYKLSGGLVRGHNIEVHNTGTC
jgi:hypothetical protein